MYDGLRISHSILIVDDDSDAAESLSRALKTQGISVGIYIATQSENAIQLLKTHSPTTAILDLSLNEDDGVESGFELLTNLKGLSPNLRVVVLTGHGSVEHGVRALRLGASSFLEKPAYVPHLAALITDAFNQAELRLAYEQVKKSQSASKLSPLQSHSPIMRAIVKQIEFAASNQLPVLLLGETGTGKGLVAKLIHQLGARSHKAFIRYQPNFASADLSNSELFGHKKGAYTGALEDRAGLVLEADQGTLFLDELGELPTELQVTLLGVLQEKTYRPLGSAKEQQADFRLICATNSDIQKNVMAGRFRADLLHRISHITITIPPLRERQEDIIPLASRFLQIFAENEALVSRRFSKDCERVMLDYSWPGNVRQLQALVEAAASKVHHEKRVEILAEDILPSLENDNFLDDVADKTFSEQVEDYKYLLIRNALEKSRGNQAKAAEMLKIDRSSMRRILSRGSK